MPTTEEIRQRKQYDIDHRKNVDRLVAAGMTEEDAEEQIFAGELQVFKGHMSLELSASVLKRFSTKDRKHIESEIQILHKSEKFPRFRNRLLMLLARTYIGGRHQAILHQKKLERARQKKS
jgi:hypothetical protein